MIKMLEHNVEQNKKFKYIFDNFHDSILIINKTQNTVEYANQCFYNKFDENKEIPKNVPDPIKKWNFYCSVPV